MSTYFEYVELRISSAGFGLVKAIPIYVKARILEANDCLAD